MTLNEIRTALRSNDAYVGAKAMAEALNTFPYIPTKGGEFWNCTIEGYRKTSKGEVYFDLYWQGDSTDGTETPLLSDVLPRLAYRNGYVIPAVSYFDGERTRYDHSDLCIDKDMVLESFRIAADWLEDDAIKEREVARAIKARKDAVGNVITKYRSSDLYRDYANHSGYWGGSSEKSEKWSNGFDAVTELIDKHWEELEGKTEAELKAIAKKVFLANYLTDKRIPKKPKEHYWEREEPLFTIAL